MKGIVHKLSCLMAALLPLACAFGGTAASIEPTEAYPGIKVFQTVEITLEVGETFTVNSFKTTPSRYWLLGSVKGNTVASVTLTDAAGTLMQMEETDAYSGFTQRSTTKTKSVGVTVTAAKPGTERIFLGRQYENETDSNNSSYFAVDTLLIVTVNGEIPTSPITYVDVPEDVENPNPASFTDDDLPITLKPLEDRDDYTFDGWSPTNVIPRGMEGEQTFTAVWKEIPKIVGKFCVKPYLQHPTKDAMTIIFFTDAPCRATVTCTPRNVGGATKTLKTTGEWAEALTNNLNVGESSVWKNSLYKHRVRFDGLLTNRSYDYTVTLAGGATYLDTFRTAPDRDTPIRFVSYADCETTKTPHSNYVKNLTQMKGRDPDFITVSGDLVARGGLQENWDGFWQANAGEKGMIAGSIPVITVIGNHDLFDNGLPGHGSGLFYDMQGEPSTARFLSYFEVESNGVDFAHAPWPHTETRDLSQLFHRVDYGPVTLIFLDSNNGDDSDHDKDTNYLDRNDGQHLPGGLVRDLGCRHPDFNVGSPQYVWLTNNLAEAQAKSRFTFVFNHHCPYSRGTHNRSWSQGEDGSALALRFLTETFVRYGVDGWYCGHDELLEHSVTTGTEVLPDGTTRLHTLSIYDLGGSGDSARNTGSLNNPLEYNFMGNYSSGGYGFLETDVAMDANGRWTCTVTPYSAGKGAYESDRMIYVESCAQESGKNDLVSAEHGGISGIPSTAPSGWLAWERPPEGTAWDESVEVELSEVTAADLTYDGTVQTPHLKVMAGDLVVPRDHCTVSAWTKAGATAPSDLKDAGMYTATVTGLGNVKGEAQVSVTIGRATATVAANDASKEFGAANPQFEATVTGLQGNDTKSCLTYSFTCAADESTPAGTTCPIVVEAAETQGNYTVVCVNGTLTVTKPQPRPSETTKVTASITYGQNLSVADGTISGTMTNAQGVELEGTFVFKSGTTRPSSGTSTHRAVFTPDDDNYDAVEVDVEVTVAKATLTVKPVDMTVHSGDPAPDYAFDFEGFVNGDTKAKVSGKPVFSCDYTTASEEGATYEIRVTGVGTLSAADYDFIVSDETATLTVTKKVDEGTKWQSSYTIQEGETTGVIWAEYLKNNVAQTRWWKLDGGDETIAAPEFVDANSNEPKMSGSPLSRAKFTFTGIKAGTTTWKAYTYTDEGKVPGYKTAGGSGSWSDGSGVSITITVTPKPRQIVSAIAANATYTGTVQTPTVVVMAEGGVTVPAGSFTVGAWSPSEPKNVGTYHGTARGTGKFTGEVGVTFTITPAPVTVTADDKRIAPGDPEPELTATVTGLQGGDPESCISYSLEREPGDSLGEYGIFVTGEKNQGNYAVSFVNGTFTIKEKAIFEPGQDVMIEVSGPMTVDVGETAITVGKVTIRGTGDLTIANSRNLTSGSVDLNGLDGTVTYEYVSSEERKSLPSGLADAIKAQTDQKVKYVFRGTSPANGWNLGTWDKTTFRTHIVIDLGTHTWSQNNNGSSGGSKFGENGTDENPTLLVKDGATLDFTGKDLSGYQKEFEPGGVIRVNAGGTLNFLKPSDSNPNMNYRQRLVLDPGSLTTFAYGTDKFVLHGAGATPGTATEGTANVYVPASDGTAGPAILRCASSNGAGLCINNTSNSRGGGCAIWVGANSKLLLDSKVSKGEENDSTSNKRILAKLGPGELEITGEVTTSVDFDARAGIVTLPASSGAFNGPFAATADVTYRFPEGWAADTPYTLGSGTVNGTAPAADEATVYVGDAKLTGRTLVYSGGSVMYAAPHEPTPFELMCAAALAGEAYEFTGDMEFPEAGVLTVPAGVEFVLDLKGCAITCHADGAIVNNGKLTIVDSAKAGPLQAHIAYSAAEQGTERTLIRNAGELVLDGAFVDAGFVDGANSVFGGGNTAIVATAGSVTVKNGAHVGGQTAIAATGDVAVIADGAHVMGWRGAAVVLAGVSSTLSVSNSTLGAEGQIVRASAGAATIIDSVLASSCTTAPFNLGSGAAVSLEKSIYVDRMASWFPVTTALANDGANLKVGAGCLLAVASESVVGFLDEGVTAGAVAPRVWRTKGADDEALPPLTDEEKSRIADVLSSSPDKLLKASVTEVKDYMAYKAWVDKGIEAGTIDSQAAAKGAEGSFFSFATDQKGIVDPTTITEDKVKVEEMKVNGGEVTLTVGIDGVPVGENAQAEYLEKVFGVIGSETLSDFAADKVKYGNMQNNGDGTVSYTAKPNVEPKPDAFFFKATVVK